MKRNILKYNKETIEVSTGDRLRGEGVCGESNGKMIVGVVECFKSSDVILRDEKGRKHLVNSKTLNEVGMREYNFEVYTKNPKTDECGWDIKMVSVLAESKKQAKEFLNGWDLFDCIILYNYGVEVKIDEGSFMYTVNNYMKGNKGWIFETFDRNGYRPIKTD